MSIAKFLHPGAENATPAADLCRLTGLNARSLRQAIADERNAGAEILYQPGGRGGYFLPSSDPIQAQHERGDYYRVMRARALSTFEGLRPVARALGIPVGQLDMLDLGEVPKDDDGASV